MPQAGFGAGFETYAAGDMRRLTRLASMLTSDSDSARDLVQETLIRVGIAWSRIDRDGNPSGYATTTMSRLVWRQQSRRRAERALLSSHRPETSRDGGEFSRIEDAAELGQAMQQLGPRQRAVLVMRFYCDMSEAAAADALGCSTGTVKSQTARGLANLRARLQQPHTRDDEDA